MSIKWDEHFNKKTNERLILSTIGEMMRLASEENALSLTAGEPYDLLYPSEALKRAFEKTLNGNLVSHFSYSNERTGIYPLRSWIKKWMADEGLLPSWVTEENIFITSGSQEGLNFVTELLLEEGQTILVESPTYPEALLVFTKEGARFLEVPLEEDGPNIEAFKNLLKKERISFFYSIVNYQNPTGYSTSAQKKKAILELAREHNFLIIEDDPYHHLYYDAPPEKSYLSLAGEDCRVIYLGSFSKIVAPGLRTGWVVAPKEVIDQMLKLRVLSTLCPQTLPQEALFNFLQETNMPEYLSSLRHAYRRHRDAMIKGLEKYVKPLGLSFQIPKGGFFIWGRIPMIKDMHDFARFCIMEEKVAFIPGDIFFAEPSNGKDTIRFSFAKTPPEKAIEGCRRLGSALKKYLEQLQN
jgi:2-aminoadipate transaminase